jgi:ADP-ribose pyrophosphatase
MKVSLPSQITNIPWLNLFNVNWEANGKKGEWVFASRKKNPQVGTAPPVADAVIVVPIHINKKGERHLVVLREFRIPLGDSEFGFPAGLANPKESYEDCAIRELKEETGLTVTKVLKVSPAVYSSTGLSDESVSMVFVECEGEESGEGREATEEITVFFMDLQQIADLCNSQEKQSCKLWPVLLMFSLLGKLEL